MKKTPLLLLFLFAIGNAASQVNYEPPTGNTIPKVSTLQAMNKDPLLVDLGTLTNTGTEKITVTPVLTGKSIKVEKTKTETLNYFTLKEITLNPEVPTPVRANIPLPYLMGEKYTLKFKQGSPPNETLLTVNKDTTLVQLTGSKVQSLCADGAASFGSDALVLQDASDLRRTVNTDGYKACKSEDRNPATEQGSPYTNKATLYRFDGQPISLQYGVDEKTGTAVFFQPGTDVAGSYTGTLLALNGASGKPLQVTYNIRSPLWWFFIFIVFITFVNVGLASMISKDWSHIQHAKRIKEVLLWAINPKTRTESHFYQHYNALTALIEKADKAAANIRMRMPASAIAAVDQVVSDAANIKTLAALYNRTEELMAALKKIYPQDSDIKNLVDTSKTLLSPPPGKTPPVASNLALSALGELIKIFNNFNLMLYRASLVTPQTFDKALSAYQKITDEKLKAELKETNENLSFQQAVMQAILNSPDKKATLEAQSWEVTADEYFKAYKEAENLALEITEQIKKHPQPTQSKMVNDFFPESQTPEQPSIQTPQQFPAEVRIEKFISGQQALSIMNTWVLITLLIFYTLASGFLTYYYKNPTFGADWLDYWTTGVTLVGTTLASLSVLSLLNRLRPVDNTP